MMEQFVLEPAKGGVDPRPDGKVSSSVDDQLKALFCRERCQYRLSNTFTLRNETLLVGQAASEGKQAVMGLIEREMLVAGG